MKWADVLRCDNLNSYPGRTVRGEVYSRDVSLHSDGVDMVMVRRVWCSAEPSLLGDDVVERGQEVVKISTRSAHRARGGLCPVEGSERDVVSSIPQVQCVSHWWRNTVIEKTYCVVTPVRVFHTSEHDTHLDDGTRLHCDSKDEVCRTEDGDHVFVPFSSLTSPLLVSRYRGDMKVFHSHISIPDMTTSFITTTRLSDREMQKVIPNNISHVECWYTEVMWVVCINTSLPRVSRDTRGDILIEEERKELGGKIQYFSDLEAYIQQDLVNICDRLSPVYMSLMMQERTRNSLIQNILGTGKVQTLISPSYLLVWECLSIAKWEPLTNQEGTRNRLALVREETDGPTRVWFNPYTYTIEPNAGAQVGKGTPPVLVESPASLYICTHEMCNTIHVPLHIGSISKSLQIPSSASLTNAERWLLADKSLHGTEEEVVFSSLSKSSMHLEPSSWSSEEKMFGEWFPAWMYWLGVAGKVVFVLSFLIGCYLVLKRLRGTKPRSATI